MAEKTREIELDVSIRSSAEYPKITAHLRRNEHHNTQGSIALRSKAGELRPRRCAIISRKLYHQPRSEEWQHRSTDDYDSRPLEDPEKETVVPRNGVKHKKSSAHPATANRRHRRIVAMKKYAGRNAHHSSAECPEHRSLTQKEGGRASTKTGN